MGKHSWWKLSALWALGMVATGCQNQDPNKSALWGPNMPPAGQAKAGGQGNAFSQPAPAFPTAGGPGLQQPMNNSVNQIPNNAFSSSGSPNIPPPMPTGSQFGAFNGAQPGQPYPAVNVAPPGGGNFQPVSNIQPMQNFAPMNGPLPLPSNNVQGTPNGLPQQNFQPFNPPVPPTNPGLGQPSVRGSFPQGN